MSGAADENPSGPPPGPFAPPRDSDARSLMGPYGVWPYADRRRGTDRRLRATPLVSRFSLRRGSRAAGRRRTEQSNIYVDRYDPRDLRGVVAILVLNLLDAWLTLVYL